MVFRHKKAKLEDPEPVQPTTSYRDRAKERREGINKDFELDPDDLVTSNPVAEDEQERRLQQIEESKYLGGDVEHTHLVKGLDFALLEKVKNDQKLAEKLSSDKNDTQDLYLENSDSDSEEEQFRNEAILAASILANSKREIVDLEKLKKGQSTEIIPCRTAIARRILNALDEKWPDKSEMFLPGRMSYTIPMSEDTDDFTVTRIVRSKADSSAQDDGSLPNEADFALDQLINIIGKIRKSASNSEAAKKHKGWLQTDKHLDDYDY